MIARRWGKPPWAEIEVPSCPLAPSAPDVAIIGGGLTGASAAYHLARRGVRTVLLEAARAGGGASGQTGGLVLEGTALGVFPGADSSIATLRRLVAEEAIECGLSLPGCWEIAHRDADACTGLPWTDGGAQIRIVRTVPGGVVEPMALLSGIACAAVLAGAVIHENAPVRRIVRGEHLALELDGASIRPAYTVIAMNAWTNTLLGAVRPVRSALTFACATEPLDREIVEAIGLAAGIPFYTVDLPYLWGRLTAAGCAIFGAGLAFDEPARLDDMTLDAPEAAAALRRLENRVRQLHPALTGVRIAAKWAGPIGIPADRMPLIGPLPGAPRILVAGGYAGHGVALSVLAGRLVADAITDGKPLPPWGKVADEGNPA